MNKTTVSVSLEGRRFTVQRLNGDLHTIKERKVYAPGRPYEALYDRAIWHHSRPMPKSPSSIINRILAAESQLEKAA